MATILKYSPSGWFGVSSGVWHSYVGGFLRKTWGVSVLDTFAYSQIAPITLIMSVRLSVCISSTSSVRVLVTFLLEPFCFLKTCREKSKFLGVLAHSREKPLLSSSGLSVRLSEFISWAPTGRILVKFDSGDFLFWKSVKKTPNQVKIRHKYR
jgi:hypothetical protein